MATIELYSKAWCGFCSRAAQLLDTHGVDYAIYDVEVDAARHEEMLERVPGARTVPQIFIDGVSIGGYTELAALARSGRLDAMLAARPSPGDQRA